MTEEKKRTCTKCNRLQLYSHYHKHAQCKDGINSVCKECRKPLSAQTYLNESLENKLWYSARNRANKKNREFSITLEDIIIPESCPVLGVPLKYKTDYAPSLDRIDPSKGYIKDNVQVLSKRANMLKNNGTIEEFKKIIQHLEVLNMCEIV